MVRRIQGRRQVIIALAVISGLVMVKSGLYVSSVIQGPAAIGAGYGTGSLAASRNGRFLYVDNFGDYGSPGNTVTVIDLANRDTRKVIKVGEYPTELAASPDGGKLYVLVDPGSVNPVSGGGSIVPVNPLTGAVGRPLKFKGGADEMALSPDGRTLYVIGGSQGSLVPVNVSSGAVGRQLPLPEDETAFAVSPDGKTLYVAYGDNGNPSSYEMIPENAASGKPGRPVRLADEPTGIAVAPDGRAVYLIGNDNDVPEIGQHSLMVVNPVSGKMISKIKLGVTPRGLVVDSSRNLIFIQGYESFVEAVSTRTGKIIASLRDSGFFNNQGPEGTDFNSCDLAVSPDGKTLYVSNGKGVAVLSVSGLSGLLDCYQLRFGRGAGLHHHGDRHLEAYRFRGTGMPGG